MSLLVVITSLNRTCNCRLFLAKFIVLTHSELHLLDSFGMCDRSDLHLFPFCNSQALFRGYTEINHATLSTDQSILTTFACNLKINPEEIVPTLLQKSGPPENILYECACTALEI